MDELTPRLKECKPKSGETYSKVSELWGHGTNSDGKYEFREYATRITIDDDGSITLFDEFDEVSVVFFPSQLPHLKEALAKAQAQLDKKTELC